MNPSSATIALSRPHQVETDESEFAHTQQVYARVTVIRRIGTTSSRVGDRFLVTAAGELRGFSGGGCVRSAIKRVAAKAIETGQSQILHVVPKTKADLPAEERAERAISNCPSQGEMELFVEPIFPKPCLAIFGDTYVAGSIKPLAEFAGWQIVELQNEPAHEDLPDTDFAVVATMGNGDKAALKSCFAKGYKHVLFVASTKKVISLKQSLQSEVPVEAYDSLISPAGLNIGAKTPEEIAISIVAELISLRQDSEGQSC
ncbi:XdhC and CoxI family protein [Pseudovibrio axinellae]|uniref:XdhC and CoxI family protein n=1 Tax=Pseudovibrio axinellae TaxID=989403 RepID=A0A165T482_9HYPH|nr:XdhC family protein [Pseudovibrio axinellae]KZL05406.1 XdhC and CoxI family protein [Pseudovibrio axinellae]SEQ00618.1 xanthine dehydrogenase accessory factor [Pseudovibrio axinellae]